MADKYINNAAKAEDNRSTGITLVIVGAVGLIIILLGILGVIPLPVSGLGKVMSLIVLGTLSVVFFVTGIMAINKSKEFASQIKGETDKETAVLEWFREKFTSEYIDMTIRNNMPDISDEEIYFQRYGLIRSVLYKQFPDLGTEFIDHMTDEVYEDIFGDE